MTEKYALDALVHEAEWRHCSEDILYFVNTYVHVSAVDMGGRVLMSTTDPTRKHCSVIWLTAH